MVPIVSSIQIAPPPEDVLDGRPHTSGVRIRGAAPRSQGRSRSSRSASAARSSASADQRISSDA
jgi:hypothetical protein